MARVLVVGGAGYVGSAACAWLLDRGHRVWVLDDLSTGHRELLLGEGFTQARAGDPEVADLLKKERFDCAMHFAARSLVAESVQKPDEYYENNVVQTRMLLDHLLAAGINKFIFSSTCAIFGDPGNRDISEDLPKNPINPYGRTKLQVEEMLAEYVGKGLQSVALRYFNACGAEPKFRVGEWHQPESHVIPNVLSAAYENREFFIFGDDYPTPDGTCVRDYIHVSDLAQAHEAAMMRLIQLPSGSPGRFEKFNLGSENGFSVRQVLEACEKVVGRKLKCTIKERRPGDPPRLVADSSHARHELGFKIEAGSLERIISSAWEWEQRKRSQKKAVFLDRDGTLNEDPGYLNDPAQMKLLNGAGEALAELKRAGYMLIVVSNQSGVGRGLIEKATLPRIHDRLDELLKPWGVKMDAYELCFHRPEENCDCRKPKPKLIEDAARKYGLNLNQCFMIGDKLSDLEAGKAAGLKAVALVRTGYGRETEAGLKPGQTDFAADSLPDVARWILAQGSASS